jgi:hypothetical protein
MRTHTRLPAVLAVLAVVLAAARLASAQPQAGALPPISAVTLAEHGGFLVNGKPFFPILLYDVPTDAASLKLFHESGFNTLTTDEKAAAGLPAAGFYAAVHTPAAPVGNVRGVLMSIGMDSPALNWKDKMLEQVAADKAKAHAMVAGRPTMYAIGYWDDEPAGVAAGKVLGKDKYDDLVRAIDVAAPYLYPVPYQPVSTVGDAVARAKAATQGRKPVLPILQIFTWTEKDRYPTPAELKCMVYLSLIEGANGIGYYSYNSVTGKPKTTIAQAQPELWQSLQGLNAEVAKIGQFMMDAKPNADVSLAEKAEGVKLRAANREGKGMLLVANATGEAKTVTLKFPSAPTSLKRLDGKEAEPTLKLAPFEAVALTYAE